MASETHNAMPEEDRSAFDPLSGIDPLRLEGVRTRRMLAFVVDYLLILAGISIGAVAVFILGVLTLGLAWLLFPILGVLVAFTYIGVTMGSPAQATPGMQMFSLRIEREDGANIDWTTAIVHAVLFWVIHVIGTPLVLAISLFSSRKRLAHDMLLGTVVLRRDI